jgi:transposase
MSKTPKSPKERRTHTKEFKREAVALAERQGVAQTARDLGLAECLIYQWRHQVADHGQGAFPASAEANSVEAELARLRRENAQLREERDILKKAATYFARESE